MESNRLFLRPLKETDEHAFITGIADRTLRINYGFPEDIDAEISASIFKHFCELEGAYSIIEKQSGNMVGFLLEVDTELPDNIKESLSRKGRTLAFAIYKPYQRQGYMEEALNVYIPYLFRNHEIDYVHCGHFEDNEPSKRLLIKLGFHDLTNHIVNKRIIVDEIRLR